ncbi:hypothetical protein G6O67_005923 [Ophiocordyceps sinensis]|uniref:Uncharacterized protein n=1 Tax=Ophiocordyceps sinensis TaxID=72228 RepID=A0A8H4PJA4_9HYPO|nr:hypothetical protein G6O67_008893 [Ophiocordyceps sinensis]KAF4507266.1 hypothetical protein G6O67_005923 [Ophiocordyceps sinensis]
MGPGQMASSQDRPSRVVCHDWARQAASMSPSVSQHGAIVGEITGSCLKKGSTVTSCSRQSDWRQSGCRANGEPVLLGRLLQSLSEGATARRVHRVSAWDDHLEAARIVEERREDAARLGHGGSAWWRRAR